jgi:hypothetical protein
MFSYIQKPDKKYLTTDLFMFSLPVGYSNSADLYLIRKCNLKPGLKLIVRGKDSSSGDGFVNGKLWSVVFSGPVLAGTSSNASDPGRC